jgi:Zn ribbon nucleic-acid-binding protein
MFWNRNKKNNNETVITTRILRTSEQAKYEKEVLEKVNIQISTCPECEYSHNESTMIPMEEMYSGDTIETNECVKCGAEWQVRYHL